MRRRNADLPATHIGSNTANGTVAAAENAHQFQFESLSAIIVAVLATNQLKYTDAIYLDIKNDEISEGKFEIDPIYYVKND